MIAPQPSFALQSFRSARGVGENASISVGNVSFACPFPAAGMTALLSMCKEQTAFLKFLCFAGGLGKQTILVDNLSL